MVDNTDLYDKLVHVLSSRTIDELGLVEILPNADELPTDSLPYYPLVVVDTKLGLSWQYLSMLLSQAHARFVEISNTGDNAQLEKVTRAMVLLKPENYTAMNARKKLVISGYVTVDEELSLVDLIFTVPKHAKSSIAWHHRRWLHSLTNYNDLDFEKEFSVCTRTTTLYPKNYYSWNYRHWLLSLMETDHPLIKNEYQHARRWVELNVSDHSGVQHLEHALQAMTQQDKSIIAEHISWLDQLIVSFPGHESLWCHRRFWAYLSVQLIKDWTSHRELQHTFVEDVIQEKFTHGALNRDQASLGRQAEFALRFGLWLTLLVRREHLSSLCLTF
ncbi:hypothetical protein DFQ28_001881 [Apophysomyces sp. BC1034]|nr:hypothetical protein DFQ29_001272 [Apophysomyces sp. BC1021]KAG0190588.1 hypothetical protein DFQ28_001881 [Apophysomyces sp. BC1034]